MFKIEYFPNLIVASDKSDLESVASSYTTGSDTVTPSSSDNVRFTVKPYKSRIIRNTLRVGKSTLSLIFLF